MNGIAQQAKDSKHPQYPLVTALGYFKNGDYCFGGFWGDPGQPIFPYVTLFPHGEWDTSFTTIDDTFPGRPQVTYLTHNQWFWEVNINLDTRP